MLKSKLTFIDEILPFALVIICVASARFMQSELTVFLVFVATLAVYVWRKYDDRIFVGMAIFLLLGCAVLLLSGAERYANEVAVWAYYFLVVGVFGALITNLRERKYAEGLKPIT